MVNISMGINESGLQDFISGQKDKESGYYDKWYRWNRKDDGRAYDMGFNSIEFTKEIKIIECVHN